jgi:hypothetical protein
MKQASSLERIVRAFSYNTDSEIKSNTQMSERGVNLSILMVEIKREF